MKGNDEPWKNEPWYKLMYNDVPGQITIEAMPERSRGKPSPVDKKVIEEEVKNIKVEIAIRDVEEILIEDVISVLAAEEEEIENSAAEILSSQMEGSLIDEFISDMALLTSLLLDEGEQEFESYLANILKSRLGHTISPSALRNVVYIRRMLSDEDDDSEKNSKTTPVKIGEMSGDARSPSNESDTTEDIVFLSPGSLDSNDGTVVSSFMMGEGSNI